jgi:hypothetical protein
MTYFEPGYDVILIGAGESGKAALEALREKGKNALYIELAPETVATMVSRSPLQSSGSGESSSQPQAIEIGGQDAPIRLFRHAFQTPAGETVTYTLQALLAEETESAVYTQEDAGREPANSSHYHEEQAGWKAEEEPEVLEAEQVEYAAPYQFASDREIPLREKFSKRRKISFQEHASVQEMDASVYTLERLELDDEDEDENWNNRPQSYQTQQHEGEADTSRNSLFSGQPPVYRERELKLRKRLFGIHRLNVHEHAEPLDSRPRDTADESAGFSSPPYGQESAKPEPTPSPETEANIFTLEPFSRKRARSQKKARFQQKRETSFESLAPSAEKQPASYESREEPQSAFYTPFGQNLFGGGHPSIQPFSRPASQKEPDPDSSGNQDTLKKDDIELEDAYGGYNSWEEFLTPFSEGTRKRQELDKVEKRKIALRGLHNLINNLG